MKMSHLIVSVQYHHQCMLIFKLLPYIIIRWRFFCESYGVLYYDIINLQLLSRDFELLIIAIKQRSYLAFSVEDRDIFHFH